MFSRTPVLLPFSGPRSTGSAAPDQRHSTPKVWQTARSAASSLARIASKRRKAGSSQAGSSRMPWLNAATPSFCARVDVARARPCPRRARTGAPGASGSTPERRTSKERTRTRSPASSSGSDGSQLASMTAWTSESWPRLGQPWFMSSTATSIARGSAAGTSSGRSTRTYSKIPQGALAGQSVTQNCRPCRCLKAHSRGMIPESLPGPSVPVHRVRAGSPGDARGSCHRVRGEGDSGSDPGGTAWASS